MFKMGRYAMEPDNATKSAKAKGSNLRVHFKVKQHYRTTTTRVRRREAMASKLTANLVLVGVERWLKSGLA